ncbi:MAG TPA: DUF2281 domain-containing protein [Halomicronema sp.]
MTLQEQLMQEINKSRDFLVEEVLDFFLFAKPGRSQPTALEEPKEPRPFGLAAGEFTVPPDFNDPLPEEIFQDFEGSL